MEDIYFEYLNYLYDVAKRKYGDCSEIDTLVQDSLVSFIARIRNNEKIDHPKGFLSAVLKNKYNDWLRRKYKNSVVLYEYDKLADMYDELSEDKLLRCEEYREVRREIGRLQRIYREVTVRHYVHGHSVEKISEDLKIPKGTVLSRLSTARSQIKEGIENMEKYSQISYEPKYLSVGIEGCPGLSGEPNSLLRTQIEQNILILAYENPVSIRGISDSIGIPCAFVEDIVNRLVAGELMGRTERGLVYTRFYIRKYSDSFGDISAQENVADLYAEKVWEITSRHFEGFNNCQSFLKMSNKQKVTLILTVLFQSLLQIVVKVEKELLGKDVRPPERPNGGWWLAKGQIKSADQVRNYKYEWSGPLMVNYFSDNKEKLCSMLDFQSSFGDTHWSYPQMKYKFTNQDILRFLASFLDCNVKTNNMFLYELVSDFEKLHFLKRDESGTVTLDVPTLTYDDEEKYINTVFEGLTKELFELLKGDISKLFLNHKNIVPKHVDEYQYYQNTDAANAYILAQLYALVDKNLIPYPVEIGKTPLIYISYRRFEQ